MRAVSQPTTREVIAWLSKRHTDAHFMDRDGWRCLPAAISKLEALADAEDARPDYYRERNANAFELEFRRAMEKVDQRIMGDFALVTRSEFEALVSRVEACEGRK